MSNVSHGVTVTDPIYGQDQGTLTDEAEPFRTGVRHIDYKSRM